MDKRVKIGEIVEIEIIGLQDYGAFVKFDKENNEYKGLIHISEVKSGFVKNIREHLKIGQKLPAQIIDIDEFNDKISLSLRALEKNPVHHYFYRKQHFTDPRNKIGFETIAKNLEMWVSENLEYLSKQK